MEGLATLLTTLKAPKSECGFRRIIMSVGRWDALELLSAPSGGDAAATTNVALFLLAATINNFSFRSIWPWIPTETPNVPWLSLRLVTSATSLFALVENIIDTPR